MENIEIDSKIRREQAKLGRQIEREKKRGRLSERTKSAIAAQALGEFVQSIAQQKINQIEKSIQSDFKKKSNQAEISVETTTSQQVIPITPNTPPAVPQDLPSFMVDVCNNGTVARYRVYGGKDS